MTLLSAAMGTYPPGPASAANSPAPPQSRKAEPVAGLTKIGYAEAVTLDPGNVRISAQVDTGALSSSLGATDIETFRKGGREWVRFVYRGDDNLPRQLALPVSRTVRIRHANAPMERRYVVKMGICLGSYHKITDVNLANRKGLTYRMLIGRKFMAGAFIIDPRLRYLTRPSCKKR
jgi:hypothetical protein